MRLLQQALFSDEPTYQLVCDDKNCRNVIEAETEEFAEAKARRYGWWVSATFDACGEHVGQDRKAGVVQ